MVLDDEKLLKLLIESERVREVLVGSDCPFLFASSEYNRVFDVIKTYFRRYKDAVLTREKLVDLLDSRNLNSDSILLSLDSIDIDMFLGMTDDELDDCLLARVNHVFSMWCLRERASGLSDPDFLERVKRARYSIPSSFFKRAEIVSLSSGVLERLSFNFEVMSPFGIKSLDTLLGGGMYPGEAALIIGPKNVGKTFFGVNIAKWNMLVGNLVVFFTMETRKTFVLRRLDTCIFRFKPELFDRVTHQSKQDYIRFLKNFQSALSFSQTYFLGDIVIFDYPSDTLTTYKILNDLEMVEKEKRRKVDTIIVDYLEIMKGGGQYEAKRMELASIATQLRSIAQNNDCSVFVLSQGNRESRKALYVDSTHSSESWAKPFAFDFVLGLSEDAQDPNKRYVYLADSRRTAKKIAFTCEVNFFYSQWNEYGPK